MKKFLNKNYLFTTKDKQQTNILSPQYHRKSKIFFWIGFAVLFLNSLPPFLIIFFPESLVLFKEGALGEISNLPHRLFSFNILNLFYYNMPTWYFVFLIIGLNFLIVFKYRKYPIIIISSLLSIVYALGLYFRPINYVGLSNHVNDESLFYSLALISINLFTTYKFVKISLNN